MDNPPSRQHSAQHRQTAQRTPRQPAQNQVRQPEPPHGETRPVRRPPPRRKKKQTSLLPAIVLGIVGVVIIALIIMGVRSLVENSQQQQQEEPGTLESMLSEVSQAPTPTPEPTPTPAPSAAPERDITGKEVQALDSMVIVGDCGYDYYKFNTDIATSYINSMNKAAESASGKAQVYSMILPSAVDIMLPLSFLNEYAEQTSDQDKATQYIFSKMSDEIHKISLFAPLKAHCDEDLYFRTDNHLTSLGAYYVYEQWAQNKGVTPLALSDCEKKEYEGFVGNLYERSQNSAISEPETLLVYEPKANLSLQIQEDGEMRDWSVFVDVTDYGTAYKYSTFLGGSHSYAEITNNDLSDGSACVLVIDSNGTPLAPYIATHYQTTYVIDYRDYTGSAASLAEEKGASDIIYFTSIVATSSESLSGSLSAVVE